MRPFAPLLICATLCAVLGLAPQPARASSCPDYNALRNPYFGELHVHTAYSFDAVLLGVTQEPEAAYEFAKGAPIPLAPEPLGRTAQLRRPLHFATVTDHSEFFGEFNVCLTEGLPGYDTPFCEGYRGVVLGNREIVPNQPFPDPNTLDVFRAFALPLIVPFPQRALICGPGGANCLAQASVIWRASQDATEAANEPCDFTTFQAYEWTANTLSPQAPSGANLHRNVIFRNGVVPPLPASYFEAPRVEQLWEALTAECLEGEEGCDVLTIPHNSNFSSGQMFAPFNSEDGSPLTAADAAFRASIEPVAEVLQVKGSSECKPGALTNDELCGFESYDRIGVLDPPNPDPPNGFPPLSFVRNGLKEGLVQEEALGVNPFKLGLVAATDGHNATPGLTNEEDWGRTGHQGANDFSANQRLEIRNGAGIEANPGGLAVIWAEENTRDALFDAIRRREVYGTSGTRPVVRFFGSWKIGKGICDSPNAIQIADRNGVPMGGDLPDRPGANKSPRFLISVQQDPGAPGQVGTSLQRIQIVKGWLDEDGAAREAVIDVAGEADNGADVDLATCQPLGDGQDSLCTVWEDPDFDGDQRAFYYARVLENPTCRWSHRICVDAGADCEAGIVPEGFENCCSATAQAFPKTVQERAWTSPIWYRPEN